MKYLALAMVAFAAGAELGLTPAQASARAHALTPIAGRKGWYTATGPVQFKAGEEFHHDGDLPKSLAQSLEAAKRGKAEAAARAEAEAKAKAEAEAKAKAEAEAAAAAAAAASGGMPPGEQG